MALLLATICPLKGTVDALYKTGERHICAKFNRVACHQMEGHTRKSKKIGELIVQHHICSYILHCTGNLCGQR